MRRPSFIILISIVLALILGWFIGNFITGTTVAKAIASIPGSPIVMDAKYNKEKHSIEYSVLNPGGTELRIVEEAFVFKPGKETKEEAYVLSHIPANIKLPPRAITKVELALKAGTEKLHFGDVVMTTFTYTHGLSNDLYTVMHPFTMEKDTTGGKEK